MSTPLRVLFLDDDGCDALAITNELRGAGFSPDFVRVETEEQYLKELDRTYELILAENDLPRLNVSRALHRLKELDLDIPFIVIAGNGGEEAVAEWMRKGAADYLVKDRLARLGPSVVRALGDKRLRDHKRWSNVALKNSEKRLRAMIENSSDGISLLDADATMVYTSPAITRILGYGVDELVGCNMLDWMHPDDVERVGSIFKALIKHPSESVAIDFHYKHKDGSWRWMESVVTNLVAEPSVQALVLNYRDITERKRADEERERVTLQLAALVATSLAINARTDLDSLLPIIIRRAADLLQAGMGALFFSDSERLDLELVVGYNIPTSLLGTKLKRSEGVAGCVAESGEPLTVTDYSSWPGRAPAMSAVVLGRVQGVPLRARGHIIGVLEIMDGKPGSFAPDEIRLVSVFADQAAIAIDNARLLAEKDRRADEFAALYQSSSDLAAQHELPELLKTIMHSAARLLRAPGSSLYLYDSEHDELVLQEVCNLPVPTGTRLKMGEGHAGMVAQTRQPLIVADYATSPLRSPRFGDVAITSALQVPILFGGDLIGVLAVHHTTKTTEFTQADQRLLSLFAIQVASAVHNAQLFRESMHRAEQLAALNSAALTVQQQFDPMEIYRQAANELQHLGHMASIFRIDDGQLTHVRTAMPVESPYQLPDHTRRLDGGITLPPEAAAPILARLATGETAIDRQLVSQVIPRLPARLQTTAERVLAEVGSDAVLVAPLMRGAQPIGVMLVVGQHLDDSDVLAVSLFARHISSALENARLFAEMRRQQEQLSVVNRIASAVNGTLDLDELLALVHEQLSAALAFDAFFVALYDAAVAGNRDRVTALHEVVMQISDTIYSTGRHSSSFMKGLKCALAIKGICDDFMAEPFHRFRETEHESIRSHLDQIKPLLDEVLSG